MELMQAVEHYATAMKLAERYGNAHGDMDAANNAWHECKKVSDEIAGVLRYCRDVQAEGTANERVVAQTVARMLARPPSETPNCEVRRGPATEGETE